MIYIIGVSHDIQKKKGKFSDEQKRFKKLISTRCKQCKIGAIIEEFIKSEAQGKHIIAKKIARQRKIPHAFCEPSIEWRKERGIDTPIRVYEIQRNDRWISQSELDAIKRKHFELRENYWMGKIREYKPNCKKIIFICGDDHVENMIERFSKEKWSSRLIGRIFTPERQEVSSGSLTEEERLRKFNEEAEKLEQNICSPLVPSHT